MDDRGIAAREMHRYAERAPDDDLTGWAVPRSLRGWTSPAARPPRLRSRRLAAMRPQRWKAAGLATRPMDHRIGHRYPAFRLVSVRRVGGPVRTGLLYNISRNGMFVLLRDPEIGMQRCVEVELGVVQAEPVIVSTLAVHQTRHGVGFIFRHLDAVAAAAVEALCSRSD